ncbi:MAG: proteasome subunit beta, partial [Thermofilum sp.]
GAQLAISILEASYRRDMSVQEAEQVALKALEAAMKRDAVSGDGIDMLVITRTASHEKSYTWPLKA